MLKKFDLFKRAKSFWPQAIPLDDAVMNDAEICEIPSLVVIYEAIEARIGKDDHLVHLSAWAFHQALWSKAIAALQNGTKTVHPDTVSFEVFDKQMLENLEDPSWSGERLEYSNAS